MNTYAVIAEVNNKKYFTSLFATSCYNAEHQILDLSYAGIHYTVTGCTAYDYEGMKTETFTAELYQSNPISYSELRKVIENTNEVFRRREEAQRRVWEIEKQMKMLQIELDEKRAIAQAG